MKLLLQRIASTDATNVTPLVLRIAFAVVMFPHGAQLLTGWFGGYGYIASMGYFSSLGLSPVIGFLVIFLQFFGSLFIIAGLFTRVFALASLGLVAGMIITVHFPFGFFMNWYGSNKGEGFEYHILMIGILISLMILGGGKASIDSLISDNRKKSKSI